MRLEIVPRGMRSAKIWEKFNFPKTEYPVLLDVGGDSLYDPTTYNSGCSTSCRELVEGRYPFDNYKRPEEVVVVTHSEWHPDQLAAAFRIFSRRPQSFTNMNEDEFKLLVTAACREVRDPELQFYYLMGVLRELDDSGCWRDSHSLKTCGNPGVIKLLDVANRVTLNSERDLKEAAQEKIGDLVLIIVDFRSLPRLESSSDFGEKYHFILATGEVTKLVVHPARHEAAAKSLEITKSYLSGQEPDDQEWRIKKGNLICPSNGTKIDESEVSQSIIRGLREYF